eukprot:7418087-Alexandrium_andersonii.AAC.1
MARLSSPRLRSGDGRSPSFKEANPSCARSAAPPAPGIQVLGRDLRRVRDTERPGRCIRRCGPVASW